MHYIIITSGMTTLTSHRCKNISRCTSFDNIG